MPSFAQENNTNTIEKSINKDPINANLNSNNFNTFNKYDNAHLNLYASDFRYVIKNNDSVFRLYDLRTDSLIILFYDPDCSHCEKEIKKLRKDKSLNKAIADKRCVVLTIPPDITMNEWEQNLNKLPKQWINAWSLDNDLIIKKYLWKVPEIFILNKDKQIIYINMFRQEYDEE